MPEEEFSMVEDKNFHFLPKIQALIIGEGLVIIGGPL